MPWGRASDGHRGKAAVIRTEIISLARAKKTKTTHSTPTDARRISQVLYTRQTEEQKIAWL